jgi:DNA gyrase/topoisomerase IV subunit B
MQSTLIARALLAYSVYEHHEGHATRVDVWVRPESFTVQDDGRGMGLDREGYVEGLVGLLVGRPGTVQLHGVGLSLIGASTPRLSIESRRGGRLWKQSFAWGIADGLPLQEPCGPETGTRITFDRSAGSSAFDLVELSRQIDLWREAHPRLKIVVH